VAVERDGSTVYVATIPAGAAGTWWMHDDPDADLSFTFEYA
jgi:hypothetical protein